MRFRLDRKFPLRGEFRRVALEQADAALERLRAGDVHRTRRRIKQIRALLDLAGDEAAQAVSRRLRDIARSISEVRDVEVCFATLDLLERTWDAPEKTHFEDARTALSARRESAASSPREAVVPLEAVRLALADWLPETGEKKIRSRLRRSYRRCRAALEKAEAHQTSRRCHNPEPLHQLRKRLKTVGAQLRLLRDYWPHTTRELAHETGRLAELLGSGHDLAILQAELNRAKTGAPLKPAIAARRSDLEAAALALASRFLEKKPGKWMKEVCRDKG